MHEMGRPETAAPTRVLVVSGSATPRLGGRSKEPGMPKWIDDLAIPIPVGLVGDRPDKVGSGSNCPARKSIDVIDIDMYDYRRTSQ